MKKQSRRIYILLAMIAATLLFIWLQSTMSQTASAKESGFFLKLLLRFFPKKIRENTALAHQIIRKMAHMTEFAFLGAELTILLRRRLVVYPLAAGLFAALIDETVQIFTGRGASVTDVWIDFAGVVIGSAVALGVMAIVRAVRRRRARKKE